MKIKVSVKTNSKSESVTEVNGDYVVRVNAPPAEGMANKRVVELLAEFFGKPKSQIELLKGHRSKKKTFDIE